MTRLKTITVGFLFRARTLGKLRLQRSRMARDADRFEAAMREVAETAASSRADMEKLRREIMEIAERENG